MTPIPDRQGEKNQRCIRQTAKVIQASSQLNPDRGKNFTFPTTAPGPEFRTKNFLDYTGNKLQIILILIIAIPHLPPFSSSGFQFGNRTPDFNPVEQSRIRGIHNNEDTKSGNFWDLEYQWTRERA